MLHVWVFLFSWVVFRYMDCTTVYPFTHWSTFVCFQFGLVWIKLPWTFKFKSLHVFIFSFLLEKYLGVESLNCMVSVCLTLYETSKPIPKYLYYFAFPPAISGRPAISGSSSCFTPFDNTWYLGSFQFWHLIGV